MVNAVLSCSDRKDSSNPIWPGLSKPVTLVHVFRDWLLYMALSIGLLILLQGTLRLGRDLIEKRRWSDSGKNSAFSQCNGNGPSGIHDPDVRAGSCQVSWTMDLLGTIYGECDAAQTVPVTTRRREKPKPVGTHTISSQDVVGDADTLKSMFHTSTGLCNVRNPVRGHWR